MADLLNEETVLAFLAAHGLPVEGPETSAEVTELGGGVSNMVFAVRGGSLDVVVKQSLPRLRVEQEWLAKRERVLTEGEALRLTGSLTPGSVPDVLLVDAESCAIVIERAPGGWHTWKDALLTGDIDSSVGARLAAVLATWHRDTEARRDVAERFSDHEAFDQLRVDPYYGAVMRRWPALERPVGRYVEQMLGTRVCLVHGDFSPKNVLVGDAGLWVIDFEVAHVGEPVFDLAFMTNHLMLKAIHRPASAARYRDACLLFYDTYRAEAGSALAFEPPYLVGHVGCLMVARVDGKSPAEYLTATERLLARSLGTHLLLEPPGSVQAAWAELELMLS